MDSDCEKIIAAARKVLANRVSINATSDLCLKSNLDHLDREISMLTEEGRRDLAKKDAEKEKTRLKYEKFAN